MLCVMQKGYVLVKRTFKAGLHGEGQLGVTDDLQQHHVHGVPSGHELVHVTHVLVRDLTDVHEAIVGAADVHKRPECHDGLLRRRTTAQKPSASNYF